MIDPYLSDLKISDDEAAELLELLDKTNESVGAAIAKAALPPDVGNDREVVAAQLASVVAYLEHVLGFERFDDLLHLVRVGYKSSFPMGIRSGKPAKA